MRSSGYAALAFIISILAYNAALVPRVEAQTLIADARASVVYIHFDITDPATGGKQAVSGTGFVVTTRGYVLTAAHLFRGWKEQLEADRAKNDIRGTVGHKPGFWNNPDLILQVIDIGDAEYQDIALLKLPESGSQNYQSGRICFRQATSMKEGDSFAAFGFPLGNDLQQVPGVLGSRNAPRARWAAATPFIHGMSGGPVYNPEGYIFGMIKGGVGDAGAVRWITPIEYARAFLYPPFVEDCGEAASVKQPAILTGDVAGPPSSELKTQLVAQCSEASNVTSTLANSTDASTWRVARDRFWILYWGPMYTLETFQKSRSATRVSEVEGAMVRFGQLVQLSEQSQSELPHATLRESLRQASLRVAFECSKLTAGL